WETTIRLGAELPAPAGVVGGLAKVASEGGVDDDAGLPRPGMVGRDLHSDLQAPGGAAFVELHELLRGEAPTQAPAKLGHEGISHPSKQRGALGRGGAQAALALLPLVDRRLERHSARG